jgi:CheY-like chemotaxis protein
MQSVLIVDTSTEAREVLRTALERRGWRIFEAAQPDQGLQIARQHHPDVIVVDLETEHDPDDVTHEFASTLPERPINLLLIGSAQRRPNHSGEGQFIAKPYHYGPLIRRIESLLASA